MSADKLAAWHMADLAEAGTAKPKDFMGLPVKDMERAGFFAHQGFGGRIDAAVELLVLLLPEYTADLGLRGWAAVSAGPGATLAERFTAVCPGNPARALVVATLRAFAESGDGA